MFRRMLMTKRCLFALAAAAATALFGACKANDTVSSAHAPMPQQAETRKVAPTGTTQVDADGVRRVTVAELQQMLDDGRAVLYDTRSKEAYEAEHIKGARSMPMGEVAERVGELPKGKTIVFYCT